jgi:hypothetical protein
MRAELDRAMRELQLAALQRVPDAVICCHHLDCAPVAQISNCVTV